VKDDHRVQRIVDLLTTELDAVHVEVEDQSAQHAGHPGARAGGGHYLLQVVSPRFSGLTPLQSQRLVYQALGAMMREDIHALQMLTLTPEAWRSSR